MGKAGFVTAVRRRLASRPGRRAAAAIPLVVGVIVCLEVRAFRLHAPPTVETPRYLVARRGLPPGQPVTALEFTAEARPGPVPAGALTDQDLHRLRFVRTAIPLAAGALLTVAALAHDAPGPLARAVPKGLRAYALPGVDAAGARPGDRVDLRLEPFDAGAAPVLVAEAVRVLRADEGIVVAMSSVGIRTVEKAKRRGTLTLALRNPMDDERDGVPDEAPPVRRRSRSIPILSEGE